MDAKELRVGNYLLQTNQIDYDTLWLVYKCYPDSVITVGKHLFTYEDDDIKPIPLTEDWLLKFGFEKNCNENYQINYNQVCGISITLPNNNAWFCNLSTLSFYEICNCSYVHQLQNLYFTLTGKEL
jgi:hypothetical protein